jgi:hypothetical protein
VSEYGLSDGPGAREDDVETDSAGEEHDSA